MANFKLTPPVKDILNNTLKNKAEGFLEKMQNQQSITSQPTASQSNKYGDVKKCPSCGTMIQSFSTHCPDCGFEFRNIEANASIQRLFEMLNNVQNSKQHLLDFLDSDKTKASKKRLIIQNFPIPNTKEDILEFLSLAIPLAKKKGNLFTASNDSISEHNEMAPTWKTKCEQIIMKAKFSMKEDKETLSEIMSYAKELNIK